MTGLSASGVDAVRAADLASPVANGRGCADAACWGRLLADPALAPAYVVRSAVSVAGSTYQLRVEMLDPRTSKVIEAREEACEICTDAEAAEALGMTASALKAAVVKRNPDSTSVGGAGVARTPALAVPVSAVPAAPPPSSGAGTGAGAEIPGVVAGKQDSDVSGSGVPTGVSWALVGAGAVAVVAGIVLVVLDGNTTSCPQSVTPTNQCPKLYRTKAVGFVAIGSGAAAGLVGGWFLATGPTTHDGRVASAEGWSLTLERAF